MARTLCLDEPALAACYDASARGVAPLGPRSRWGWLMRHVFKSDVDTCRHCGGPLSACANPPDARATPARRPLTYLRSSRFSRFDFPMRSAFQHTSTHESEVQVLKASHNAAPLGYCVLHASTHSVVSGKPHSPMQAISRKPAGSA